MRDDRARQYDVLEAIERIERYADRGWRLSTPRSCSGPGSCITSRSSGEACRGVSAELVHRHPEVPWAKIIGMRHILVHGYFEIDTQVVWEAVERDLPSLKESIARLLWQLSE